VSQDLSVSGSHASNQDSAQPRRAFPALATCWMLLHLSSMLSFSMLLHQDQRVAECHVAWIREETTMQNLRRLFRRSNPAPPERTVYYEAVSMHPVMTGDEQVTRNLIDAIGLRNRQVSTILIARNYTALKDAIREAKDEEAPYCQNWEESVYLWNRSNALTFRNSRGRFRGNGGGSFGRPQ
ncbi:hypothetical protein KGM_203461B, partial [Danaus plexippus plexippus]